MFDLSNFWIAVLLTCLAGFSTGIGGLLVFYTTRTNKRFLSISMGFSAGIMIYISFVELLVEAQEKFLYSHPESGHWMCPLFFFLGFGVVALIDKVVPDCENPHEMHNIEELKGEDGNMHCFKELHKVGLLMILIVSLHNFPEGLITFLSSMSDIGLGLSIAVAIAIHNIPEGIAISIPIFYATGSKKKALFYSTLSGLAEPIGGIIGFFILKPFINDFLMGVIFSSIAGIMVFISFDTLLPSAEKYGNHHSSILGLVIGMIVMAVSLIFI